MDTKKIMKALTALTADRSAMWAQIDRAYNDYEAAQNKGRRCASDLASIGTVSEESYNAMEQVYDAVKNALPQTYNNGHSIFIPTQDDGMFIEIHVGMSHGVKAGKRRYETIEDAKAYTDARKLINAAAQMKKADKLLAALEAFADSLES